MSDARIGAHVVMCAKSLLRKAFILNIELERNSEKA